MILLSRTATAESKGYYSTTSKRTYYHGPTRYYFFIGGHRHYYGTRNHAQCNDLSRCNQDVYMNKVVGKLLVSAAGYSLDEINFKSKLARIGRNAGGAYGISESLITVDTDINDASRDVIH